ALGIARQPGDGSRQDIGDRGHREVDLAAAAPAAPQVVVKLVTRDGEEIGTKARMLAKLILGADASEERALHELLGIGRALGGEELAEAVDMAGEEALSGALVTAPPQIQELQIAWPLAGHRELYTVRRGALSPTALPGEESAHRGDGGED